MAKILIVDDDRTTVMLLQTLLELDGFQVHTVARGGDVPAAITAHEPDLLLMDYRLIDMDGLEVIRRLRANPAMARVPIVMASGMNVEFEAREAGATAFLVKPFAPESLSKLFHSLLDQRVS